jgi:hypothetical protein
MTEKAPGDVIRKPQHVAIDSPRETVEVHARVETADRRAELLYKDKGITLTPAPKSHKAVLT